MFSTHYTQSIQFFIFRFTSPSSSVHCQCLLFAHSRDQKEKILLNLRSRNTSWKLHFLSLWITLHDNTATFFFSNQSPRPFFTCISEHCLFILFRTQPPLYERVSSFSSSLFIQNALETKIFVRSKADRKFAGDLMKSAPSVFQCSSYHGANGSANAVQISLQASIRSSCFGGKLNSAGS